MCVKQYKLSAQQPKNSHQIEKHKHVIKGTSRYKGWMCLLESGILSKRLKTQDISIMFHLTTSTTTDSN